MHIVSAAMPAYVPQRIFYLNFLNYIKFIRTILFVSLSESLVSFRSICAFAFSAMYSFRDLIIFSWFVSKNFFSGLKFNF